MRSRRGLTRSVLTLILIAAASAAGATGATGAKASTVQVPAVPATGHFHPLAAPQRLVSTVTGTGIPIGKLAAGASTTIAVTGHAGIPASGVSAISAVVTVSQPAGPTQVWLDAGAAASAAVPSVVTGGAQVSAFGVHPLAGGSMRLRNGAQPAHVTIDVTGWFSSAAEAGTSGLFTRLAGRKLGGVTVPAGAQRTVPISGVAGVPAAAVSAVLVRLSTALATAPGQVSIGATNSAGTTAVAYPAGTATDMAVTTLAGDGSVTLVNTGTKYVRVTLAALGWFTDGTDAQAFGDTLRLTSGPQTLLTAANVGTSGVAVAVAGAHGVPAETSATPPSLVLTRTTGTASSASLLLAYAQGASADGYAYLPVPASSTAAGLLLVRPGTTGFSRFLPLTNPATVSAESIGWFAGGVVLASGLRVLTGPTLAAVNSVTPTSVSFTGTPAGLASVQAGDVLAAGVSAQTPHGFLRMVSSTSAPSGNLTVQTTNAALSDAVQQGSLSAGTTQATTAAPTLPSPRHGRVHTSAAPSCDTGGSLLGGGVSVSCSASVGDGGVFGASVNASAGVSFSVDATIGFGFPPSVDVHAAVNVSTSASGTAFATASKDVDESFPLGERRLAPIDIQLGPVPLVIEPIINGALHLTGHLEATFNVAGEVHAGFGATYSSGGGFSASPDAGASGSGSYGFDGSATLRAAFEPTVTAAIYGDEDAGLFATFSPYVQFDADPCTIKGTSGVDLTLGLKLSAFGHDIIDAETTIPVIQNELFNEDWRNCALWSGSINFSASVHFDTGPPANSRYTRNEGSSSSGHIDWSDAAPPQYNIYPFPTSGSGAQVETQNTNCGSGDPPPVKTNITNTNWSGDVNSYGIPLTVSINPANAQKTKWLVATQGPGNTMLPATRTFRYWVEDINGVCHQQTDATDIGQWPQDIFGVIEGGQVTDSFFFFLPAGQMSSSGTRKVTATATSNQPTVTVSWSFTKTCTLGGTAC
jgi:hypothetical protein